jgi:ABC-type nitrate/sulfonate/bicarbonate transport system substrate-binding protein
LALVLAACGGDTTETTETTADSGATTTTADSGATTTTADSGATTTTAAPAELIPVTFALTNQRSIQYHPFYVADYLGYWEQEGLDVEIVIVSGSGAVVQQIVAGNVLIGNPSAPATSQGFAQGNCLREFYTYSHGNVFGLATPADSGIESLEDLAGQTVGISEPGGGEVPLVRAMLASVGLADGVDYELAGIGEGGALTFDALNQGRAQAYSSSVFDIASLEAAGLPLRQLMPEEFKYFPSLGLVVTCDTYDTQQDVLVAFGRGLAKATVFSQANDAAAREIAESYEPELFEDQALADAFWTATLDLNAPPEGIAGEPLGTHYLEGWELYLDFATQGTEEEGALPKDAVVLDELLSFDLLDEINDFDRAEVEAEAEAFPGVG